MRILPRALLVATLFALTVSTFDRAEPAAAFDYLTNGGFEGGTDGWSAPQATLFDVVDGNVVTPREGNMSGRISIGAGASSFSIRQTAWAGTPAGTYQLTAWIRTASRLAEVYVQAVEGNFPNTLHLTAAPSSDQWVEMSSAIQITGSNSVALTIGGTGSGGDVIYVDDVRLVGADPATMTATATSTNEPSATARHGTTATRTPTATRTASSTKTASATSLPTAGAIAIGRQLRNAGFEAVTDDGVPEGWSKYGGTLQISDADVHGGAHAARIESATNSTKWLYQTVLVDGGAAYEFSAWVRDDDTNVAAAFLRISWYPSDDGSGSATGTADSVSRLTSPAAEYRQLTTGAVVAPDDARSARVRIVLAPLSNATTVIFADDAAFDAVAAPETEAPAAATTADSAGAADAAESRATRDSRAASSRRAATATDSLLVSGGISGPHVVLNEVLYDPDGSGRDGDGEWVELYNPTDAVVSLSGWSLADATSAETLPAASIAPGGFLVIAASDSFRRSYPSFAGSLVVLGGRIGNSLGNNGDRLVLRDRAGALVDAISWGTDPSVFAPPIGDVPAGHSIERRVPGQDGDTAADFVDNMHPSPGAAFVALGVAAPVSRAPSGAPVSSQVLAAGRERSFSWLPWTLAGMAGVALLIALSWRAAPLLLHRLRQHS